MRLVSTLLFVALTGSVALADDAKPADPVDAQPAPVKTKVPLRVVRVLPETHQALLYDKNHGTHVLAELGKSIDGYKVEDIDDDEVTLTAENGTQIVLTAPDPTWRRHRDAKDADATVAKPAKPAVKPTAEPAPVDPYAIAAAPVDPYGEPEVRSVDAPHPIEAGEGGVRTTEAPDAKPAAPAPVVATPAPAPTAAPSPSPTALADATALATTMTTDSTDVPIVLGRAEVDASLANFTKLAGGVRGSFTPAGAKLDTVGAASLFAKVGLRAGDVVTAVDNQPLHSVDDAANVYARASTAKSLMLQILRAGKPVTLHVVIR